MASRTYTTHYADNTAKTFSRPKQGRRPAVAKKHRANVSLDAELVEAKKTWKRRTGFTFSRWVQLRMLEEIYKVHTEIV